MHLGPISVLSMSPQYWRTIEVGRPRLLVFGAVGVAVTGSVDAWGGGSGNDGVIAVVGEAPTESTRCADGAGMDMRVGADYW